VAQGEAPVITDNTWRGSGLLMLIRRGPVQAGAKFRRRRCVASPSSCGWSLVDRRPGRAHFERGILDRDRAWPHHPTEPM